jgi:hypothetical protein
MAIDPNIALMTQPAQIQSPLALAGQVMSLKNAGLQQQLGQQAQQEGQIRLNQAGQSWQDQQADRAAVAKNTVTNPDGSVSLNRAGYFADLGQNAPGLMLQRQHEFAVNDLAAAQQKAAITKTQLENAKAQTDLIGNVASSVKDQASYDQARQTLQSQGIDTSRFPAAYDPNLVQQFAAQAISASDKITQHLKAQEAQETSRHNAATEATGAQTAAAATTRANASAIDARNNTVRTGIEAQRLKNEMMLAPNASGLTGDAYLQTLSPAAQAQVKAMANGDIAMPPAGSRNQMAQGLRQAVMAYDPTFTDARYKAKQNFKTGPDAGSVTQLSTAMEHLQNAQANSAKVGFAPFLNANATPADAAYNKDVSLFSQEAGKLVKNGVLSEGEFHDLQSGLNSTRQSIRDAALGELTNLMGGKVSAVFQKYKTATGQELPVQDFFDKPTQQRLQKAGIVQAPAATAGAPAVAAPQTHVFSLGAWKQANPQGDARAAQAAAQQQGYQVIQ